MKSVVTKEIAMSEKNFINVEFNDDVEFENQSNEMWDACSRATEKINEYCSIIKENCNNPFSDLYCDFYEINNRDDYDRAKTVLESMLNIKEICDSLLVELNEISGCSMTWDDGFKPKINLYEFSIIDKDLTPDDFNEKIDGLKSAMIGYLENMPFEDTKDIDEDYYNFIAYGDKSYMFAY